jgi:hypothetical protein
MKAHLRENSKNQQWVVCINDHQYTVGDKQLQSLLKLAKNKFRKEKKSGIYAVVKGNVVQMLNESYDTAEDLKKTITQYKCKGFYKVHYYVAV